jgi:nucleotide-binding universal stress UspA family protein
MINVSNILYATDFSPHSNQAYFHAVAMAERHGADLTILHVCRPDDEEKCHDVSHWREQLEQIRPLNPDIAVRHVLLVGEPADEITGYADAHRIDLIVMGTHGRTGLERLLMGSVAEQVLRDARCSVLVVKMPRPAQVPGEGEREAALSHA